MYTGDVESFATVVAATPAKVAVAGGDAGLKSVSECLQLARDVLDAGGVGITFGRCIFQYENPAALIKAAGFSYWKMQRPNVIPTPPASRTSRANCKHSDTDFNPASPPATATFAGVAATTVANDSTSPVYMVLTIFTPSSAPKRTAYLTF